MSGCYVYLDIGPTTVFSSRLYKSEVTKEITKVSKTSEVTIFSSFGNAIGRSTAGPGFLKLSNLSNKCKHIKNAVAVLQDQHTVSQNNPLKVVR